MRSLLWWIVLLALGAAGYYAERAVVSSKGSSPPLAATEREAFLALSFGKIADEGGEAISTRSFREDLSALHAAGYTTIDLRDLRSFFQEKRPLPDRPILLLFDGMQRDSIEIADHELAALDMRAVAFANVDALDARNIELVSLHRLQQLVESGRWEIGISGCAKTADEEGALSVDDLRRARALLEQWTGKPPTALDCQRARPEKDDGERVWQQALKDASLRFGFVVGNPRANYVDGSPVELRRVRVDKDWTGKDLVAALQAHAPRRSAFTDNFSEGSPRPDWFVDRAALSFENGVMRLAAREGDSGALILLTGTERWRDADVEVAVQRVLGGQFWLSLRGSPGAFVRVGFSQGRIVLQKSDGGGETHEMGARAPTSSSFVLRMRMLGDRVTASVDGEPLLDRPVEVPSALKRGPVALAVWGPEGTAAALVKSVVAVPLRPRAAIVPAEPGAAIWERLREGVGALAVLSPRYFAWKEGRGKESTSGDLALEIFSHHRRLAFLPLVEVETQPPFADLAPLGEAVERWASRGGFEGVNLAVSDGVALDPTWRQFVTTLRGKLEGQGRTVAVTVLAKDGQVPAVLQDFGSIFALGGNQASELESAVGPLALVGPPSG